MTIIGVTFAAIAAVLLAIVSFGVPFFKSVYFLKASISEGGFNGSVLFGTFGYCLELSNGTTCSKHFLGYEFGPSPLFIQFHLITNLIFCDLKDFNSLQAVGNGLLPIHVPQVLVKWIPKALIIHFFALIIAVATAFLRIIPAINCIGACLSGLAAALAMLAFVFDLIFYFVAKAKIISVGSAHIGSGVWLTLAAWILLFLGGIICC